MDDRLIALLIVYVGIGFVIAAIHSHFMREAYALQKKLAKAELFSSLQQYASVKQSRDNLISRIRTLEKLGLLNIGYWIWVKLIAFHSLDFDSDYGDTGAFLSSLYADGDIEYKIECSSAPDEFCGRTISRAAALAECFVSSAYSANLECQGYHSSPDGLSYVYALFYLSMDNDLSDPSFRSSFDSNCSISFRFYLDPEEADHMMSRIRKCCKQLRKDLSLAGDVPKLRTIPFLVLAVQDHLQASQKIRDALTKRLLNFGIDKTAINRYYEK